MSKNELETGMTLRYAGRPFEGFDNQAPQATFLGYDCSGWSSIWIEYLGTPRLVSLSDIALDEQ